MLAVVIYLAVCLLTDGVNASPIRRVKGSFPLNEYDYSMQRDNLLASESTAEGPHNITLNEDEKIVDGFLKYLKWREFKATKDSGFPPSRPIEEKLDYIRSTAIYQALKKLPKGGNMHSHEDHQLSKRRLLELVFESTDFDYFWMLPANHPTDPWKLDFFVNPPDDSPPWVRVKDTGYTVDDILPYQTLIGLMTPEASRYPTDSGERWKLIDPLWGRGSTHLVANINIKTRYLEEMYLQGLQEGVTYYESKKNFGPDEQLYELDPSGANSATYGKRYLDEFGDLDVDLTLQLSANFSALHPEFIGHRRTSYTHRQGAIDGSFQAEMENVARLHAKYPDHVLGFDTVGQEDAGNSLLYYLERFLAAGSSLPLYLHTVETSWSDDLISSGQDYDPVGTLQNSVDTLLLHAKRIGHGTAFIKHPYRMELVRQRGIAIESCAVSNQLLGYIPDLRQHPALTYYRYGIPIVLGADDPGTFGYDDFTVDWYEIFEAWGFGLADLKQLAFNSLWYSGMSQEDKIAAIEFKWIPAWDRYIAIMKLEACTFDYASNQVGPASFARILPREGANSGTTTIHVYGRNFESAICKTPVCRFGVQDTPATYVDSNHLICEAPAPPDTTELTVGVSVALDGVNFVDTGETFTYKYDPIVPRRALSYPRL